MHGGSSFSLDERDGKALFVCWSGCDRESILNALRALGLWPEREQREFTAEERRDYGRRLAEARRIAQLAANWRDERLLELEAAKEAAVDFEAGRVDDDVLQRAAQEARQLSSASAAEVLRLWQLARTSDPRHAQELERAGASWSALCERLTWRIVAGLSGGKETSHAA